MIEFKKNNRYKILTPTGYEEFSGVRKTSKSEVVAISLSNDKKIKASLDHRFIINNKEILAKNIVKGDYLSENIHVIDLNLEYGNFELYDPVDVGLNHLFISDSITSHNCDFLSSGTTVFLPEVLEYFERNTIKEPLEKRGADGNYWIFDVPDYSRDYVVVADVARGDGADYSACHVLDLETNTQVAEYKGQLPTKDFGFLLVEIATSYNKALLVVENASIGWSTLQTIQDIGYQNLYFSPKGDIDNETFYDPWQNQSNLTPGFTMSYKSRPMVISKLGEYIDEKAVVIQSKRTLSELRTFIWVRGKAEAQRGYNDDLIMCLGIGMYLRDTALRYRKNGIDMTKQALNNIQVNRTAYQGGYSNNQVKNPYEIDTRDGNKENINWLL